MVQDKLFLPGLLKLKMLRDSGFFGRILSVRGEFGYWVFEGDWQPAQRPSWNYRKADGGGIILDMLCHWRYVLDNLFGEVEAVCCLGATHIPSASTRRASAYTADADDAAYATFQLEGGVVAQINSSWDVRVRRDDLVTFQVDGTHGSAVAGLHKCCSQHRVNTPKPVWNPDQPQTIDFFQNWEEVPDNWPAAERLQGAVGDVPPPRRRRRALAVWPRSRRQGRAAGRCSGLQSWSERPLAAMSPGAGASDGDAEASIAARTPTATHHRLPPQPARRSRSTSTTASDFPRIAYAAAHVVADPLATNDPWLTPAIDWDTRSNSATACGTSASASPKPWTPRSAAWGSAGPRRRS